MSKVFDLEQQILRCWNITDDLGEILDDMEQGHMEIAEAVEALRAYQKVYQRRFERCFNTFEDFNKEFWDFRTRAIKSESQNMDEFSSPNLGKKGKSKKQKEVDH
jgi:hypothetical protein